MDRPQRPVIGFLSDFGSDSAAAICRGVILSIARDAQIVDIDHGVRKFAIGDGAFLLWAALPWLPVGVHLAVVDPGVGTERRAIGLRVARGDVLIGPDNGLLIPAAERLGGIAEARLIENRTLMQSQPSATFHGRDVFAPVAAHLATGVPFDQIGGLLDPAVLVGRRLPVAVREGAMLIAEVVYVDSFGNARLAARPGDLPEGDATAPGSLDLAVEGTGGARPLGSLPLVRAFGEVAVGGPLLYEDSNGLLAVGVNQGDAAAALGLRTGDRVRIAWSKART
jgi:S-adenosylmethionine hydrolase